MFKLTEITKSFRDGRDRTIDVLRGINLEAEGGDFIAVTGASGSGKTTLLSILGTLVRPDSGSYTLDGVEMTGPGIDLPTARNRKTGFVFQDHRLMPQLTVLDNILLPVLATQRKAAPEQIADALGLMEMTGIRRLEKEFPPSLSGGEQSRTALCRALIMKPSLLVADEPTGQLDVENARNIVALLSLLNRETGTTIVMATHSAQAALAAKRALTLRNGVLTSKNGILTLKNGIPV
jgi:ABC-type lipoprotein export system ATPase subunit